MRKEGKRDADASRASLCSSSSPAGLFETSQNVPSLTASRASPEQDLRASNKAIGGNHDESF